jgi:diguanylate cyclase (GGDEF)-like protein
MMPDAPPSISWALLKNCLNWFLPEFNKSVVNPLEAQFPNYPLPATVRQIPGSAEQIIGLIQHQIEVPGRIDIKQFVQENLADPPTWRPLFKQAVLLYRRHLATYVEDLLARTFHLELTAALRHDLDALNVLCQQDWFQAIASVPLPRLSDYLSVQFIEESSQAPTRAPREYDEKFHILQAPTLFLRDLAYFRAKCEVRDVPVAIAFLDIDDFKRFNSKYTEPVVDRNLLPRFMLALEAHVYQHGFAYRQGGDEYLVILPSMSKPLAITFFDDLRTKVAALDYPQIDGSTTVSIGVCIAESGCPLTDRELRDLASRAKKFAKDNGKNCIATFDGLRLSDDELRVVSPKI